MRLIVCMDFDTYSVHYAYSELINVMNGKKTKIWDGWETSDEWYPPESDNPGDPEVLQSAITSIIRQRIKKGTLDV